MTTLQILGDFNVLVIGPSSAGKTIFIQKHATGDFISEYTPTTTSQTTPISFHVTGDYLDGMVNLNVHDYVSGESWEEADAAIFMFDNSQLSLTLDPTIHARQLFQSYYPTIPTVLAGNKSDLTPGTIFGESTFMISSKTNFNYEKPFLHLVRCLLDDDTLNFEEMPAADIPIVQIHPSLQALALQELETASAIPLPDIEENDFSDIPVIEGVSFSSPDFDDYFSSSDDEF